MVNDGSAASSGGDRRLRADARRNRTRVLDVAERTFAERGLSAPIDEIARRAGVGVGTVYRHFPTKETLFAAIVTERVRRLAEYARDLTDSDDPGGAFFDFFVHLVQQAILNKALFEALSEAAGLEIGEGSDVTRELADAEGALLTRVQRAGAVRGDIDVADVKALMKGCLAAESDAPGRVIAVVRDGLRTGPVAHGVEVPGDPAVPGQ